MAATGTEFDRRRLLVRNLLIKCPTTGFLVDTGHEVSAIPKVVGRQRLVDCPECGQDHSWHIEDVFPE